ncbi:MAG: hypothetical protein KY469_07120 [Actinobacteria bacterium]|nr:hypothetical protein [Actinomycetota bacterium]
MADDPLRLVVFGDSLAFTTAEGPQLPDHPGVYPNVLRRLLEAELGREVEVTTLARAGLTIREAWRWVTKDRHAQFDVLARADALVVAIGSFDHAPAGTPAVLDAVVPYVRSDRARRGLRRGLHLAYPWFVRVSRGRRPRTPDRVFDRLYDQLLLQLRGLVRGAAGVVMGPTSHRSDFYAHRHPGHTQAEARQFAIAQRHGFPTVPSWPHVLSATDRLNIDGIHWPEDVHAAVAAALATPLLDQLRGTACKLVDPWDEHGA